MPHPGMLFWFSSEVIKEHFSVHPSLVKYPSIISRVNYYKLHQNCLAAKICSSLQFQDLYLIDIIYLSIQPSEKSELPRGKVIDQTWANMY